MSVVAFKPDSQSSIFRRDLAPRGPVWLNARRAKAMEAFERTGIPNRRVEAWKYTDLSQAMEEGLTPVAPYAGTVSSFDAFAKHASAQIVFANGLVHRVEAAEGIDIVNLASLDAVPEWVRKHLGVQAAGADQPLGAASLAWMQGGVAIRVSGKNRTLHLDFLNPARDRDWIAHTRVLLIVDEGANLQLLESHGGESGGGFLNLGFELVVNPNAQIEHIRLQKKAGAALHVTTFAASLSEKSGYRGLYTALGGKLSRVDAKFELADKNASAFVNNIAVLDAGIADTTTVMDHALPHTQSRQLFKSVVGGRGRSVSQGRVSVREGAVKADSHQLFKALLLSPRAEADAKPELEIFADDVVCGHGTAIGALDADAMFYLRARGIPDHEARDLLVRAFLEEAMENFGDEDLRSALWTEIDQALAAIGDAT